MTPNKENIRKWVEALRSGDFEQGRSSLTTLTDTGPKHCCLGVACVISGTPSEVLEGRVLYGGGETAALPDVTMRWLGLDDSFPSVTLPNGHTNGLTGLNDNGMPFANIADLIEAEWLS